MPKGQSSKVVFKPYSQHQMTFLPASLEELIPARHRVRVVSRVIDQMDLSRLLSSYAPVAHPDQSRQYKILFSEK